MADPVLIVGAGPTGLNLALRLQQAGVPFRLIDAARDYAPLSRALIVHARTLELYRQLGLADLLIERGTVVEDVRLREAGREVAAFSLRDMGTGISPYPFALCLPQDEHEALLIEQLAARGVTVERGVRLASLAEHDGEVVATLVRDGATEAAAFAWVAGCDGVHSRVRASLPVDFGGGTYDRLYYVADVVPRSRRGDGLVVAIDRDAFALRLPARKGRNERLIGFVPAAAEAAPSFDAVRADAERLLGIDVAELNWFSTYRVHHRVASAFRVGRAFLLGDAAHVHSPVGGQGMNTGIGDAVNLGWRLAAVAGGTAPASLLDSYEPERIAFARSLVATTDRAFRAIADDGWLGSAVRGLVMPYLVPAAAGFSAGRHALFRALSQTRIAYPDSTLSEGRAGKVRGGDRLPWVADVDNHAVLDGRGWQLHVHGDDAGLTAAARGAGAEVKAFAWSADADQAGMACGAGYLVRPDGYVGLAFRHGETERLAAYAARHGLGPG